MLQYQFCRRIALGHLGRRSSAGVLEGDGPIRVACDWLGTFPNHRLFRSLLEETDPAPRGCSVLRRELRPLKTRECRGKQLC